MPHRRPGQRTGGWVWETPGPVRDRDRSETSLERRHGEDLRMAGEIGRDLTFARGYAAAPGVEVAQIRPISAPGCHRDACLEVGL
jgi:hypothetical protein